MPEPAAETRVNSDYDSPGFDAGHGDGVEDSGATAAPTEVLVMPDAGLDYIVAGDALEGDVSPTERKAPTVDAAFVTQDASPDYSVKPAELQAVVAQDLGSLSTVEQDTTTTAPQTATPLPLATTITTPKTTP